MAKKSGRRRRRKASSKPLSTTDSSNFVPDAGPGCYIARRYVENDWLIQWQDDVDYTDFGCAEIPDVALDPDEQTVTFCNVSDQYKVSYITIYEANVRGRERQVLQNGTVVGKDGREKECLTFVILCPPKTFCHLCYVDVPPDKSIMDIVIDSDVQEWSRHTKPNDEHPLKLAFPLEGGPFMCTQSEGGHLTHFFSGNLHAIDFACDIGTPILAVADGVVIDVREENTLTGIAVSNLFEWNSILIEVNNTNDDPLFVEYVHIATSRVKIGDVVSAGQLIGTSGSVGFSPEPHLHFCAYRSRDATASTVRVRFKSSNNGKIFIPVAGKWYTCIGEVAGPAENGR